jgi:hypothetical protein
VKPLADGIDAAEALEQREELVSRDAEHLDVEVLGRPSKQPVAHPTADDQRAAAGIAHRAGQFKGERVHTSSVSRR